MILLRHTTPAAAAGLCYGMTDLALADTFEDELQQVLQSLPQVTSVLSSPLSRCRILAERISVHASLELSVSDHWKEMDFGNWEGVPWGDIPRHELDAWAEDFHHFNGHGGESVHQLATRIQTAIETTPKGALVVTHAGCIKAAKALSGDPEGWYARPAFGSFNVI
jgi:alpha-ribazole phosphatase